jgi:hypothetical protein
MRRGAGLAGLIALVGLLLLGSIGLATPASAASVSDEQGFVDKINKERSDRGLRALIFDMQIRDVARAWSDRMASTGTFEHNPSYASQMPAGWSSAAENIAWGSGSNANVAVLHQALMDSPGHRDNILGDYTRVGVGVTITGDKMYVTEDFGKYAGDPVPGGGSTAPPSTYTLSVLRKGKGTVTSGPAGISCGTDCSEAYAAGTSVTLTATPPRPGRPIAWAGACSGSGTTCTVSMTAAKSVRVTFR